MKTLTKGEVKYIIDIDDCVLDDVVLVENLFMHTPPDFIRRSIRFSSRVLSRPQRPIPIVCNSDVAYDIREKLLEDGWEFHVTT